MEEKICPTCRGRGTGQTTRYHGVLIGSKRHIETITCITCNGRGTMRIKKSLLPQIQVIMVSLQAQANHKNLWM